MKAWFVNNCGLENVVEMDWSETATLIDTGTKTVAGGVGIVGDGSSGSGPGSSRGSSRHANSNSCGSGSAADGAAAGAAAGVRPPLTITCLPCQHWCKRTATDRNQCLWSSWGASTGNGSYFFGGDTGYCKEMWDKVGSSMGPVHLAAIPIGAYGAPNERWFHQHFHMDPVEAVKTHVQLKSKASIGVHWGTFQLTSEPLLEPPAKLAAAVKDAGLPPDTFVTLEHGESKSWEL